MRVPTYANYMNSIAAIRNNRNELDKYSYQSLSGLKYQNYSGYGMKSYNIVSMEATLAVTNTFMENNEFANISLKTASLSIETIMDAVAEVRDMLSDFLAGDLDKIAPDYTGGELKFKSDTFTDYVGKTLTLKGTTYTFSNGDNSGNNIDISAATNKDDIMQAVVNKVGSSDITFNEGKINFPLYTVDGISSVLDDSTLVETGTPHTMSADHSLDLQNLQRQAFSAMQLLADTLNTNVSGRYVFGGGSSGEPVSFKYSSLNEFQEYYDGVNTIYPSTPSAVLSNFSVNYAKTGDIEFVPDTGDKGYHTIKALGGSFVEEAIVMNTSNVGDVIFDSMANTMKGSEYGAFSSLKVGDTIVINGDNAGGNAKTLVIESISADGRTVTFDDSAKVVDFGPADPTGIVINKSFPKGSVINLNGFGNNNLAPSATVVGVSSDGTELYAKADSDRFPAFTSAGNGAWSIESETYYQGGNLKYNQRISESQTLSFDVKASDSAFDKIFRALGQLAQGNIVDFNNPAKGDSFDPYRTRDLVNEVMELITSATSGVNDLTQMPNSSLYSISAKFSADYSTLTRVMDNQKLAVNNLENNIGRIKDADKDEAAVKLLMSQNALEASYSVLSTVSKLSLLDYMK